MSKIAHVKYAFALEVRPSSSGPDSSYGFILPENKAPFVGEEIYNGILAAIKAIKSKNN